MAIPFYHLYICQVTYHLKDLDPYPCCYAGIHTVKDIEHSDQRNRPVPGQHIKSKTTVSKIDFFFCFCGSKLPAQEQRK